MDSHKLTPREQAVMQKLLDGLSEKEVAKKLDMSRHTVHGHIKRIHLKLGVSSRSQLMLAGFRMMGMTGQPSE